MSKSVKIFEWIKNKFFGSLFERIGGRSIFIYDDPFRDGLSYWRERILVSVLAAGTILSLLALIPAAYMSWAEKRWLLLFADFAAFLLVGSLLVFKGIGLKVRATMALMIPFMVGVFVIVEVGFTSGGPAWLFFFAVLSGVLLGLKAALVATVLNGAVLAVLGFLAFNGILIENGLDISLGRAVAGAANFTALNAVSAVSVAVLLNRLQSLNRQRLTATAALEAERAELLKTKDDLKHENTIRRESEKALAESERKYRLLTESIRDVIWTMDMGLRFTYVSPAIVKMQGWSPEAYLNLRLEDILTSSALETVTNELGRQYALGQKSGSFELSSTLELEMRHKDGSTLWTEVTASFMLGEDNTPVGILGVTRDITERKKASKERERLLESLERSKKMEALGTLAGGVAHDLNNVLSGIVSYPDLLLMDLTQGSPLRKPIETIRESGKRAAAIVQDLLTLARRGVSASQVLALNDLITEYLGSPEFERLISFHPVVEVTTELDPTLLNTLGSSIHLSKTVMNLISNAAEAMPEGGRITITTENTYLERPIRGYSEVKEGPFVLLKISDSGVGISSEDLQRIFEPFYTKKKMGRSGTGLGMAVVWGTVQDHKGYIDVRSAEGRGTVIELYLPATSQEPSNQEKAETLDVLRGNGEKILIVDDLQEQREIATRIVAQLRYAAGSAASGEEAVEYLKHKTADLVILDMIMDPGIDGLETYRRILEFVPDQKAIIATGFAETDRVKQAQTLGAGGYLKKPYSVEELGKAIKAELERQPMETGRRKS